MQAGDVPRQVIESLPRRAAGGIDVDAVQPFEDVHVIGNFKIGHGRLAEAFEFDVLRIVLADGDVGGDDVGDCHHVLFELRLHFGVLLFDGGKAVGVRHDLRAHLFRLLFLPLLHELPHLFGQRIARRAQRIPFGDQRPPPPVEFENFVHERQFFVLKFFADVLPHEFRIVPDKIDVDHTVPSPVV